ncbi:hypothetical protein [Chryseobacterium sp. 2R14A]|uniref:hypothetical protein n=1 Tax=Chryseobacterium sp. 2R14A TaxID=3380353 RepID=UPI003CEED0B8
MLKQYNNKGIKGVISFFSLFLLMFCSKNEPNRKNNDISSVHSVKYVGGNEGVKLSEDKQKKVFGKWKLTNAVFFNDSKKLEKKIIIDKNVTVAEQSIFDTENNTIANKYNTIGTYQFKSLDTLNTVYYIFSIEDDKMMMQTSNLFRVVDGKMTKEKARINLFFVKE